MIETQISIIIFNYLFGLFFCLVLRIIDFFITKNISFIISSFLATIATGVLYIIYLENNAFYFYNILFITLGFFSCYKFKYLNIDKYLKTIKKIIDVIIKFFKIFILFMINYRLWIEIKKKFKKSD